MHADNSSWEIGMHIHIPVIETLNMYMQLYTHPTLWIHKQYFNTYKFVLSTSTIFWFLWDLRHVLCSIEVTKLKGFVHDQQHTWIMSPINVIIIRGHSMKCCVPERALLLNKIWVVTADWRYLIFKNPHLNQHYHKVCCINMGRFYGLCV